MSEGATLILTVTGVCTFLAVGLLAFMFQFQKKVIEHERELLRAVIVGQENEQARVAGELHDSLGIDILAARNILYQVRKVLTDNNLNTQQCDATKDMLDHIYQTQRRISHNLMPSNIEKYGLVEALKDFVARINESDELKASIQFEGIYERLEPEKELMVYRIIQEFTQNTMKHAKASLLTINLSAKDGKVQVRIADNGDGFNTTLSGSKGLGMKSIESRVVLLNAFYDFYSKPGEGTQMTLNL